MEPYRINPGCFCCPKWEMGLVRTKNPIGLLMAMLGILRRNHSSVKSVNSCNLHGSRYIKFIGMISVFVL